MDDPFIITKNDTISRFCLHFQESCVTDKPMPAGSPECEKLIASGNYPKHVDIVYIKGEGKNKDRLSRCNPPSPGKYGKIRNEKFLAFI